MSSQYVRLLRSVGVGSWLSLLIALICAFVANQAPIQWPKSYLWLVLWMVFGGLFWISTSRMQRYSNFSVALLVAESSTALLMSWLQPNSYEGFLLIIIAWQLALSVSQKVATIWVIVQTAALIAIIAPTSPRGWALAYAGTCFAFKTFTYVTVVFARRESEARAQQQIINAELIATREFLIENSRSYERLRISRDLHDSLGHQLTALAIHLEVALNQPRPAEVEVHVRKAQSIAKNMLQDVRYVAGTLRKSEDGMELNKVLQALAGSQPGLKVHLSAPRSLQWVNGERAHTLLRCVQEVITNTLKHARAQNLWISIQAEDGMVRIETSDDGCGQPRDIAPGLGLMGMRERFEQLGGSIVIAPRMDSGFSLHAWFPILPFQATV
jgi:signal transduction histidine kinase